MLDLVHTFHKFKWSSKPKSNTCVRTVRRIASETPEVMAYHSDSQLLKLSNSQTTACGSCGKPRTNLTTCQHVETNELLAMSSSVSFGIHSSLNCEGLQNGSVAHMFVSRFRRLTKQTIIIKITPCPVVALQKYPRLSPRTSPSPGAKLVTCALRTSYSESHNAFHITTTL